MPHDPALFSVSAVIRDSLYYVGYLFTRLYGLVLEPDNPILIYMKPKQVYRLNG